MSLFQPYELDLDPGEKDTIEANTQPGYWHVYPRASIGSGGVRLCNGPSIKAEGSHEIVGLMAIRLPGRDTKITLENRSSAAVHLFITAARGFHISVERLDPGSGGGASTFLDLTDSPASYSGQAGKVAAVKAAEDGLEFIAGGGNVPPFWLPSTLFKLSNGTPISRSVQWGGATPRWNVWVFKAPDYNYVATDFLLPSYYNGEDITIKTYWCKEDTGAGDWREITETVAVAVGETINAGGVRVSLSTINTVPAVNYELQTTEKIAVAPAFVAGDLILIMEGRAGPSGADTYTGDILFLGAKIDW